MNRRRRLVEPREQEIRPLGHPVGSAAAVEVACPEEVRLLAAYHCRCSRPRIGLVDWGHTGMPSFLLITDAEGSKVVTVLYDELLRDWKD